MDCSMTPAALGILLEYPVQDQSLLQSSVIRVKFSLLKQIGLIQNSLWLVLLVLEIMHQGL